MVVGGWKLLTSGLYGRYYRTHIVLGVPQKKYKSAQKCRLGSQMGNVMGSLWT